MTYADGQTVRLWDRVLIWYTNPANGVVVASVDTAEFATDYPLGAFSYPQQGILIETDQAGLMHVTEYADFIRLRRRGGPLSSHEWQQLRAAQHSRTAWTE
jgi:hypothetical protein